MATGNCSRCSKPLDPTLTFCWACGASEPANRGTGAAQIPATNAVSPTKTPNWLNRGRPANQARPQQRPYTPTAAQVPSPPSQSGPVYYNQYGNLLNHPSATKSFTFGLLSIICFGFIFGIVALYYGITAIQAIDANPQAFKGKGFAITGIVLGAIGALAWFGILFG